MLQTSGRTTARALADALEVSVRTIYRDIDHLSAAGVPVYAELGQTGGFQLLDGYRVRLTGLDAREGEALLLVGLPGPAAALGLGEASERTRLKLLASMPESNRMDALRVASRFHLDPTGWFQGAERIGLLPDLAVAVWGNRMIRIGYASWKAEVERKLGPLGIVLKAGRWYLVGLVGTEYRTYRIANIRSLEMLEESFAWPAEFSLAKHWERFAHDYEARMQSARARIRYRSSAVDQLSRMSAAMADAVRASGPADVDGWHAVEIPIESHDQALGDLLRCGDAVEVLEPPELRQLMIETVIALSQRYGCQMREMGADT